MKYRGHCRPRPSRLGAFVHFSLTRRRALPAWNNFFRHPNSPTQQQSACGRAGVCCVLSAGGVYSCVSMLWKPHLRSKREAPRNACLQGLKIKKDAPWPDTVTEKCNTQSAASLYLLHRLSTCIYIKPFFTTEMFYYKTNFSFGVIFFTLFDKYVRQVASYFEKHTRKPSRQLWLLWRVPHTLARDPLGETEAGRRRKPSVSLLRPAALTDAFRTAIPDNLSGNLYFSSVAKRLMVRITSAFDIRKLALLFCVITTKMEDAVSGIQWGSIVYFFDQH